MAGDRGKVIPERKRRKIKGRKSAPFIGIPRDVLDSAEFGALSPQATKLLLELARQYRGKNNGDFSASWGQLLERGWHSPGTLQRAKKEIVASGFAVVTRQGGRNRCSLYGVTWWAIDDCNGKHDERPTHAALQLWKKTKPLVPMRTNVDPRSTSWTSDGASPDLTGPVAYQSAA
ncbi:hypothetical protein J2X06_001227 [Lysobacter niastensis]|uniref:Helix-turn-helix domain-containing protein n=1 Tax=Lysobacter niastensis TaxID=380629 RepID=A0ABU1W8Y1_9GAMM|nr:hypothetical protein [Lysobacter niastensis]MDR7134043.1 hypothetical protein [Lysobacter niastensis]